MLRARARPELFGSDFGGGQVAGTGNPADGRPAVADDEDPETVEDPGTDADLSLGVQVKWLRSFQHNTKALVVIRPGHP